MTKEKLETEAIAKYKTGSYPQLHPDHYAFIHGYLAGAEPREKRIEELQQQIEKMKRCNMCKYGTRLGYCKIRQNNGVCENYDKWEIKEK